MSEDNWRLRRQRIVALLESYNGEKLSAADICRRFNADPGPEGEPSHLRQAVISILATLEQNGKAHSERRDHSFVYWIEPKFCDGQIITP